MFYTESTLPESARPDLVYVRDRGIADAIVDNLASVRAERAAFETVVAVFLELQSSGAVGNRNYSLQYFTRGTQRIYRALVPLAIPESTTAFLTFGTNLGIGGGYLSGTILSAFIPIPKLYMDSEASLKFDDAAGFSNADTVYNMRVISEVVPSGPARDEGRARTVASRFREIINLRG